MTELLLAKTAGFCFGVNRAVQLVYRLLEEGQKVATLGPIIHNPSLVEELAARGVRILASPEEAAPGETVVIRSHGVGRAVYDRLAAAGIPYEDATCPFVLKIHKIVREQSNSGKTILIVGDQHHPEVEGICGHVMSDGRPAPEKALVAADAAGLSALLNRLAPEQRDNAILVAQTTYDINLWNICTEFTKKDYTNIKIFDTICCATNERQREAACLAEKSGLMLVVGGKRSSNTQKLFRICSEQCETVMIETADELRGLSAADLSEHRRIGITAGASTPAHIIKEVLTTMSEILNDGNDVMNENEDFAALLEQSLESEKIYNGKRVTGVVTFIAPNEVHVDIGAKQAGIIPADEMTDDPNAKLEELVKKGDEIELCVVKVNDQEGIVTLSKKRCDAQVGFDKLKTAYEEGLVLDGVISDVVRGGVLCYVCNTKIFIPASQSSDSRVEDLNTLLRKPVKLKIIEINEQRGRAKGSVRAVLSSERKEKQSKFWGEAEIGKVYHGEVKSLTTYGAFVDLGGIDGMVHITELAWTKLKHPSEVVSVGDSVEVYIKDFDEEKKRISLGYKKQADNPWNVFLEKFQIGNTVHVKVASFTAYGAFAEIIPGVDGLIHISQIANQRVEKISDVLKIGQEIDVKIIDIDDEKKRVSLSIRALLEGEDADTEEAPEASEEPVAEAPALAEPVAEAPAVTEPVAEAPAIVEPVAEAPAVTEPVAEAPVKKTRAKKAPVEGTPVAEAPVEKAPVEEAPAEEAPEAE